MLFGGNKMKARKCGIGVLSTILFVLLVFSSVCMANPYSVNEASFTYRYNGSFQDINAYASVRKDSAATTYGICTENMIGGSYSKVGPTTTLHTYYVTVNSGWTSKGTYSWGGALVVTDAAITTW